MNKWNTSFLRRLEVPFESQKEWMAVEDPDNEEISG